MGNPFAPRVPIPGGCGSALCGTRAWLKFETPNDALVILPCERCAGAATDVLLDRHNADLALSLRSADCHTVGPL